MKTKISIGEFFKESSLADKNISLEIVSHKELFQDSQGTKVSYTFSSGNGREIRIASYTNTEAYANDPNGVAKRFLEDALNLGGLEYNIETKKNKFCIDITGISKPTEGLNIPLFRKQAIYPTDTPPLISQRTTTPIEMRGLVKKLMKDIEDPMYGTGNKGPVIVEVGYIKDFPGYYEDTTVSLHLFYGARKKEVSIQVPTESYKQDKITSINNGVRYLLEKSINRTDLLVSIFPSTGGHRERILVSKK